MITILLNPTPVRATSGLPDSPAFGYGVSIDITDPNYAKNIDLAVNLGFDWVSLGFNWKFHWPDANTPPDLGPYVEAVSYASGKGLNILLSISSAPEWVMSLQGPDPTLSSNLVINLLNMNPNSIQAIELFPGANISTNWGAPPNPYAYIELIQKTKEMLNNAGISIYQIATVTPINPRNKDFDIDDVQFLETLYQVDGQPILSIIGIKYEEIFGEPLSQPTPEKFRYLRHYEQIRSLMLENNHQDGLIWITGFTFSHTDSLSPDTQLGKLTEAYKLLKAQLYIGSAFFSELSPNLISPTSSIDQTNNTSELEDNYQLITSDQSTQYTSGSVYVDEAVSHTPLMMGNQTEQTILVKKSTNKNLPKMLDQ
jgi:hypothetical protein